MRFIKNRVDYISQESIVRSMVNKDMRKAIKEKDSDIYFLLFFIGSILFVFGLVILDLITTS